MKTFNFENKNRFDKRGDERDGKHVFKFGWLEYSGGEIAGGEHITLGAIAFRIHRTDDGSGLFGRYHFANESEQLKDQGTDPSNVEGFYIREPNHRDLASAATGA